MGTDTSFIEPVKRTACYRDRDPPVIGAAGDLLNFFVNAENILDDKGFWKNFKDDTTGQHHPVGMIQYAIAMMHIRPDFRRVIGAMASHVATRMGEFHVPRRAISGGATRDWLFSGPVAYNLGWPHVILEKGDTSAIQVCSPDGRVRSQSKLDFDCFHIADLNRTGSSCYRQPEGGQPEGWFPRIEAAGGRVVGYMAFISRLEGGEELLTDRVAGGPVESLVALNDAFLLEASSQPDAVREFKQLGATKWTEKRLCEKGTAELVKYFAAGEKPDKPKAFLGKYAPFLKDEGRWQELASAVQEQHGRTLDSYMEG